MNDIDGTLLALADPTRRWVVDQLRHGPRRAGDLAHESGMSAPAMSRHLRVLRKRGMIEVRELEDDARVRLYRLRAEPFRELRRWLDEVESLWIDQLDAFKQHAEQVGGERNRERKPRKRR